MDFPRKTDQKKIVPERNIGSARENLIKEQGFEKQVNKTYRETFQPLRTETKRTTMMIENKKQKRSLNQQIIAEKKTSKENTLFAGGFEFRFYLRPCV